MTKTKLMQLIRRAQAASPYPSRYYTRHGYTFLLTPRAEWDGATPPEGECSIARDYEDEDLAGAIYSSAYRPECVIEVIIYDRPRSKWEDEGELVDHLWVDPVAGEWRVTGGAWKPIPGTA